MAYLHCHNCDWSQDDFWDERYNPLRSMLDWEGFMLDNELDGGCGFNPVRNEEEDGEISVRELLLKEMDRAKRKVEKMKYKTKEEFRKENPEGICPRCGRKSLDID